MFDSNETVNGVVECTSFHIDRATEIEIVRELQENKVVAYWQDGNKDNVERLYHSILRKATTYKSLTHKLNIPYVIAVYIDFKLVVDSDEIKSCLYDEETGIFQIYPNISGVLLFSDNSGQYKFSYFENPGARYGIRIPNGLFPPSAA